MNKRLRFKNRQILPHIFSVLFLLLSLTVSAQEITVSGTVTDETDSPLTGATVRVVGTENGAVTDLDGNYSISEVPNDATLQVSFIGYSTQEMPVNGNSTINFTLTTDQSALEEVVVVGYGEQREEAVTGSVASIDGENLRDVPSANITESLQGRLPGVQLNQTSSKPGSAMQIRIRGTRSLTASNNPLIVLDGVPFSGSISDISPNDIKSIDILKDASATAIYGSRGANGVILITTKDGRAGQEPQFSYNTFTGIQTPFSEYPMMSGPELVELREAAGIFTNGPDEMNDVNTDWQDLFYRNGLQTNHDIGIQGGMENGSYNFGLGYYQEEAVVPGQEYDRFSLRGSLTQSIGDHLRFGITTYNNFSTSLGNNLGLYGVLSSSPIADPYNEDGSLKRVISMASDDQWVYTEESIESLGDAWIDQTESLGSYNNIFAEIDIPGVEGLQYRLNAGLNYRTSDSGDYTGQGVFSATPTTESVGSIGQSQTRRWLLENILSYDKTFGEHTINFTGLYSSEGTKFNSSYITARDIPTDQFQFYNLGRAAGEVTIDPDSQNYYESGLVSYMGRIMYEYDNRYFLTGTVRSDGSSRLADGYKWNTYPAVSAGWNIIQEDFMDNVDFLNNLKIRAGYGETSNQAVDPYQTLGLLATRPYNFGSDNYSVGYYVSQLPNPSLGWEYSTTWNYGLDFALLDHRLSGTLEYYITNTKDLLLGVELPATSGVGSVTQNVGETQNKGVELSLNSLIIENQEGLSWEMGVNFYSNNNELVSLASGQTRDEANSWFVGYPVNSIFDYEYEGLWQEDDQYLDILEPGGSPGMIKVKYTGEYNADGTPVRAIGPEDRQVLDVTPDFQGGFNTRLTYKGFDFTAVGAYQNGGILISTLHGSSGYLNLLSGRRGNVDVDYWTPETPNARYPAPDGIRSGDNPQYGSTLGYFDASYFKIRTLSLGHNFQNNLTENLGVDRLRLYGTVQNALVMFSPFHDKTGLDPQTNSYGDENAAVTTSYDPRFLTVGTNSPATRNFLLGLNLTF